MAAVTALIFLSPPACAPVKTAPRWFLPISGELKLGGRYQLTGNASGTVTRCEPPMHLGLTWEFGGQTSWVDVVLSPSGDGGTYLELTHVAHIDDGMWAQFGPGAVGIGWDLTLLGLGEHISTKATKDEANAMAWMGSAEGKDFMRQSNDGWRDASIASGTDASEATEAAKRTIAAYTGEG
ncbi:MAG: SRPBCC domain-containing protein [Gemmatimonadaceae bacterium]